MPIVTTDVSSSAALGFAGGQSVNTLAAVASNQAAAATLASELDLVGVVVDGRPQVLSFSGGTYTLAHPVSADVAVGDFILLGIIANPITSVQDLRDTAGNVYSFLPNPGQAAYGTMTDNEGSALGIAWTRVTRPLRAGVDQIVLGLSATSALYIVHGPRSVALMGVNYRNVSGLTPALWTWRQSNPDPNNDFAIAESTQADSGEVVATTTPMIVIGLGQGLSANITNGQVQSIAFASRPWDLILENSVDFRTAHASSTGNPAENSDGGRRYTAVAFQTATQGDILRFAAQESIAGAEALIVAFRVPTAPAHPLDVGTAANVRSPHASHDLGSSAAVLRKGRQELSSGASVALHSVDAGGNLDVQTRAAVE